MFILLLALSAGIALGYSGKVEGSRAKAVDSATTVVLFVILAIMGAKLASPQVLADLGSIGAKALAFSAFAVAGSIIAVKLTLTAIGAIQRKVQCTVPGEEAGNP